MNSFVVSARKYRPDTFDTVVGQQNITQTLKNAIKNNHLAQAFLFCGPRGVGKTTTARILAKTINCQNLGDNIEACNQCDSCVAFNNGQSLNIYELDAASNNSVDDIRALVEQVRYAPQGGRYKVYIIDEVHMLSASAFNAFLKTLEEPPKYAIFILATTEKHKIIPTILSRCQIFDFARITVEDISKHLQKIAANENVVAEEDALHIIAQKADGALRDALSMFDQQVSFSGNHLTYKSVIENLNVLDYDYYFKITDFILNGNVAQALLTFNDILNHGFDGHNFITGLASHFRDLLVCQDEVTLKLLEVSTKVKEKYKFQSKQAKPGQWLHLLDMANECDMEYRNAKHQRLHVELALMKMCWSSDKKKVEPVMQVSQTLASGFETFSHQKAVVEVLETPGNTTQKVQSTVSPPAASKGGQIPNNPTLSPAPSKAQQIPSVVATTPTVPSQPAKAEIKPPIAGSTIKPRTISISATLAQKEKKQEMVAEPEVIINKFTDEQLQASWNEFAEGIKKQGPQYLYTALTQRKPEVKEDFKLSFILDNTVIEKELNNVKTDLLTHLRKKLNNTVLSLETTIDRQPTKIRPYTPKEKFDFLAAKNPALHELKKQFDLDIEY